MDIEALKAELKTTQDAARRLVIVKQLGQLLLTAGNHVDARRAFESAVKFAPQDVEAVRGLRLTTRSPAVPPMRHSRSSSASWR